MTGKCDLKTMPIIACMVLLLLYTGEKSSQHLRDRIFVLGVFITFLFNFMCIFFLTFSFLFVFICMPSIWVAFKRPKGIEEGGQEGDKHEEIVHEKEEVKEEKLNENEKGTEITKTCDQEKNRESGDEEKAQDIPEQGKEKEPWNKENLQGRFSQDDDR